MKPNNITLWVGVIFAIAGFGMLILSGFLFVSSQKFVRNSIAASGTVTGLARQTNTNHGTTSYTYSPEVSFTDKNGNEHSFVSNTSSNPPAYRAGDIIKILYNPQNSQDAKIDSFFELWGGVMIFSLLGIVFFLVGTSISIWFIKRFAKNKWLKSNGQAVEAIVQSVGINDQVKYNGRSPYVITSQWVHPSSNSAYIFKSDNTWINPEEYIKPGDKIKVIIDPNNPKKYFVDISFLPVVKN